MLLLSTLTLFQLICQVIASMFPPGILPGLTYLPITLPLSIWGANGFMIWRCAISYQDTSNILRIPINVLLLLLSLVSLGCGVMVLVNGALVSSAVFILLSLLVNIILAALIVSRLIYHRKRLRKALGEEHGSPHINFMTIFVESAALIVILSFTYTVLAFTQRGPDAYRALIPLLLLPHICVISPFLIVYRLVMGRAIAPTLPPSQQVKAQIRFNTPLSSQGGEA
ncbi:hypothetical protein M413DRAFT_270415 [Hebeloma cylindrosporum]|uniref:Uncharacterized protein n=1 Tax=Hebeloma cylindrosporum TaxID=76867 RepID=A0A0C3CTH1_HEBCY|nr:hypothetical protein M413DRAFT_270415 [Hebeloma cylindrosporum h7]